MVLSGSLHQKVRRSAAKLTLFRLGGGTMCPPCHVFAYTREGMRIGVLTFFDFSSCLVWKR